MADKRFDPVTGYEIKALPEGSLNAGQEYLVKPGGGFDSLYYSNSADTSQPSGASIKPMNIIDDYDSATNTYNYGHLTGMTIEQYEDAYKAQKNGTLDSFDPNASGSADVSSTTSGEYTNATGGSADNSGIMSGTASSQPAQIVQQIDTSGLAQAGAMSSGFNSIEGLLSQYNTAATNQMNTLNQTTTDGFAEVGSRFDTVDTANSNVQNLVNTGFQEAEAARAANLAATGTAFELTGGLISDGFATTSGQLTDTQANVLGGQGDLQDNLDTMANSADLYAQQSLENQQALQSGQDGFVSSFDTYTDRYEDDQEISQNSRNDIFTAQANQSDQIREDIQDYENSSAQAQRDISAQLAELDRRFVSGFAGLDAGQIIQARNSALSAAGQSGLDPTLSRNFYLLGNSFDENGRLAQASTDQQGNVTRRFMDELGNININTSDVAGNSISTDVINLRQTLQQINNVQNVAGSNASMGSPTPASGFASPFTQTG